MLGDGRGGCLVLAVKRRKGKVDPVFDQGGSNKRGRVLYLWCGLGLGREWAWGISGSGVKGGVWYFGFKLNKGPFSCN